MSTFSLFSIADIILHKLKLNVSTVVHTLGGRIGAKPVSNIEVDSLGY